MSAKDTLSIPHLRSYISGIPYPTTQQEIVAYARNKGGSNGVIHALENLPKKSYAHEEEVLSLVSLNE